MASREVREKQWGDNFTQALTDMLNVTVEWRQEVSSSKSYMSSGDKDVLYAFCCPYSIDYFILCVRDQAPIYLRYHVFERLHDFRALSLLKV